MQLWVVKTAGICSPSFDQHFNQAAEYQRAATAPAKAREPAGDRVSGTFHTYAQSVGVGRGQGMDRQLLVARQSSRGLLGGGGF